MFRSRCAGAVTPVHRVPDHHKHSAPESANSPRGADTAPSFGPDVVGGHPLPTEPTGGHPARPAHADAPPLPEEERRVAGAAGACEEGSALALAAFAALITLVAVAAVALVAAVTGLGDRDEGQGRVVLVALAGLAGADLLGERLGGVRICLVAVEHDGLLLGAVGGGDADVLPALALELLLPGAGEAVDAARIDHLDGHGEVGLRGGLLRGALLGGGLARGALGAGGRALGAVVASAHAADHEEQHHQ